MEKKIYRNISVREVQFDEFWGFVCKKQYNLSESEKLSDEIGMIPKTGFNEGLDSFVKLYPVASLGTGFYNYLRDYWSDLINL